MLLATMINLPTIVIAVGIGAVVAAIVVRGIRRRRRGEGGCSCGCGQCPHSALCHGGEPKGEKGNK